MSVKAFDFKKEYRYLYMPKEKPVLVEVPPINFIMVDGKGDPNNNSSFVQAIELLYGLSYNIKMSKMKGSQPEGYFEYVVPPLEGLWWIDEGLCVQMMHIGPYSTEPATIKKMEDFIEQEGLQDKLGSGGKHHEIYLSDPRKSKPQSMKTVLRHPVARGLFSPSGN